MNKINSKIYPIQQLESNLKNNKKEINKILNLNNNNKIYLNLFKIQKKSDKLSKMKKWFKIKDNN